MKPGDYVLATKWQDGDPRTPWVVGFYDRSKTDPKTGNVRHFVVDEFGNQMRPTGFRKCETVSQRIGVWLLMHRGWLESSGTNLWEVCSELKRQEEKENT